MTSSSSEDDPPERSADSPAGRDPAWGEFDRYVSALFSLEDEAVTAGLERSSREGLPDIRVSSPHARFLELLVRLRGARRVLEIGTLGGFSTIFLARGVGPAGCVVSLEIDAHHAEVARTNLRDAGIHDRVRVLVGDAHETLARLIAEPTEPFDLLFIDAEKHGYPAYLDAALELAAPGAVLVADNVVWKGDVLDAGSDDRDVRGLREFNARVAAHPGIHATILQTVSEEGWDGVLIGIVE